MKRNEYRGFYWWLEPGMCCPVLKISNLRDGDSGQYCYRTPSNEDHERKVWAWVDAHYGTSDTPGGGM